MRSTWLAVRKVLGAFAFAAAFAATLAGALLVAASPTRAEQLVTAITTDTVSITSNFTGTRVVVFGTIERDAQTIARAGSYQVAVVLSGPLTNLVTRRKERRFGIWMNTDYEILRRVPSFHAVLSSAPLDELAAPEARARLALGLDMLPINVQASNEPPQRTDFEASFLRLMEADSLYSEDEAGVEFLSAQLFRAPIALPATVPVGRYTATVYLFRDGAMLSTTTEELTIGKEGFEQYVTTAARRHGFLYGLAAVALACFTGWLAAVIFRKD